MDDGSPANGGRYVTVREWANSRDADKRQMQRDREMSDVSLEERVMGALNRHVIESERSHRAQDDRVVKLADGVDHINSALDQQRGARNILLLLVGTSVVQVVALVIAIVVAVH